MSGLDIIMGGISKRYKLFGRQLTYGYDESYITTDYRGELVVTQEDIDSITQKDIDILLTVKHLIVGDRFTCINMAILSKLMSYMQNLVMFDMSYCMRDPELILPNGFFSGNPNIKCINLSNNIITNIPDGMFNGLTRLKKLYLNKCGIRTIDENAFQGPTKLRELHLDHNELETLPANLFQGLSSLIKLFLHFNRLTSLPSGIFDDLINVVNLSLSNNKITEIPEGMFDSLDNLMTMRLHDNELTHIHLPTKFSEITLSIETHVDITFTEIKLKTVTGKFECMICLYGNEVYGDDDGVKKQGVKLSCQEQADHVVCKDCYDEWYVNGKPLKCPSCNLVFNYRTCVMIEG